MHPYLHIVTHRSTPGPNHTHIHTHTHTGHGRQHSSHHFPKCKGTKKLKTNQEETKKKIPAVDDGIPINI